MASKETIVIETEARFTDNASAGLKGAGQQVDKFKTKVDGATKASEKLGGTKVNPKIGAPADKATPVFKKALGAGRSFASKTFRAAVAVDDKATSVLKNISSKVFSWKSAITGAVTGLGVGKVITTSVGLEVDQQNLESSFEVLLGSAEKAQKRIDKLTTFAGGTPFTRDEIYQASRTLQVFTGNALSTGKGLRMVGDVAAGTNQQFSDVALWVGRLYDGMKNHQAIGEATSALQEMGAISGQDRKKLEELAESGKDISKTWPQATKAFEKYNGLMEKQSNNLGNLLLGVKSFVTNNVFKKIGSGISAGISPGLQKFREWRNENKELISEMASGIEDFSKKISGMAVDAIDKFATKADKVFKSDKFKNASIGGKISIAWDELISNPFSNWWDSTGKPAIVSKLKSIGTEAAKSIKDLFKNSLKDLLPGGNKAGIEDYLIGYLGLKGGLKLFGKGKNLLNTILFGSGSGNNPLSGTSVGTMTVSAATVYVNGGLSGSNLPGTSDNGKGSSPQLPGTGNGKTGTPKMANRGLLSLFNKDQYVALKDGSMVKTGLGKSILGNIGVKLGSGAATAGGAAAVGAAGVAGIAGIVAGVGSAAKNIYNAVTSKNKEEKKKEGYRGGTKLGMVGAGAATGAAIGSVVPVVGTAAGALIGGGLGGLAAVFKGNDAGDYIRNRVDKLQKNKKRSAQSYSYDIDAVQGKSAKGTDDKLSDSTKKAARETKSYTKESGAAAKTVKSYGATTSGAASKVSGLGSYSSTAGGNVGTMGGQALTAGGNVQVLGSQATLVASVLSAAASTIQSAASQAKAAASSAAASTSKSSAAPNTRLAAPPTVQKNARGNYIGSHIISELGEEGPEMVIPLSKHRNRALGLWEQAGEILGVTRHARGGKVGNTGRRGSGGGSNSTGRVQVNVASGAIQITVQAASGSGGDVIAAIKNSKQEIANVIMNAIVDACGTSYTNRTAEVM